MKHNLFYDFDTSSIITAYNQLSSELSDAIISVGPWLSPNTLDYNYSISIW